MRAAAGARCLRATRSRRRRPRSPRRASSRRVAASRPQAPPSAAGRRAPPRHGERRRRSRVAPRRRARRTTPGAPRRGRTRSRNGRAGSARARAPAPRSARRERGEAGRCARRPRRAGCHGRRASDSRAGSRRSTRPSPRSRARRARSIPRPPGRRRASSRATERRGGPSSLTNELTVGSTTLGRVEPLLVRAARREPVERTPVWFMRQAGRSLPEYRRLREQHGFFDINRSAELTAEVTLQPVRRHDVDAAVVFADIMTPVLAMGVDVELVEGVGPVLAEPIRTTADVDRLRVPDVEQGVAPVLEAIGIVRRELRSDQAVVGFCGGPFTVAGYLDEGRPSRDFAVTKRLMYGEPRVWSELLDRLSETFAAYAVAQA